MAKTLSTDEFEAAIRDILDDYDATVMLDVKEATEKVTKAGLKQLKSASQSTFDSAGGSKTYAKGWKKQMVSDRVSTQGILYNKDFPGLPHLLEYGHATRTGSRKPVKGREHIAPIDESMVKEFERAVRAAL